MKTQNILIIILVLALSLSLGYIFLIKPKIIYQDRLIEDNRAMLSVEVFGWYENLNNPNEMFFEYWIYNYGNTEGKNIKVNCELFDKNNNLVSSVLDNYGNLASNSIEYGEVITENINSNPTEEFTYICYVDSCDNCKILYENIPELKELYKK